MSGSAQRQQVITSRVGKVPVPLRRSVSRCTRKINLSQSLKVQAKCGRLCSNQSRQRSVDACLLCSNGTLRLAGRIAEFNDRKRLDPDRLPRRT